METCPNHMTTGEYLLVAMVNCAMASYPSYVDGKPPVITLKEYDVAPWAGTTCVDKKNGAYFIVVMEDPSTVVASVHEKDNETLDTIFKSAHKDFSDQLVSHKGEVPRK